MKEKLYKKLENELKEYKKMIKEQGVNHVMNSAYEITVKQEIKDCIQYDNNLSNKQIKALLSKDNILDEIYSDWLNFDGNLRGDLSLSIDRSLNFITNDYFKWQKKRRDQER